VPGTSADKPSTAAVPDVFDPEDSAVVDVLVVVRVRVVLDHNLRVGDEVEVRWGRVVVVDWDMDIVNQHYLLPRCHDEVFSVASPLPLQPLQMVTAKMHQSCVHQVNRWLVLGILASVALSRSDDEYFVVDEEEWQR